MNENNGKLLFYGVDLTHNDIALASGTFPLGLAYIASAVKKKFDQEIEIRLFKYPKDLDQALAREKPDIYFFSNYVWNQNLNLNFAKKVKEYSSATLVVSGGPNLSQDEDGRKVFLEANPFIDFWIVQEGEVASCYLIKAFLSLNRDISRLKEEKLPSALTIARDGSFRAGALAPRLGMKNMSMDINLELVPRSFFDDLKNIDDVPSPYMNGLMDKFFDNALYPLIETNRGCPFTCSFCQQGTKYFSKVAKRSLESCVKEFEFIASRMLKKSPGVSRIEIADPNFAMFNQDLQFCEHIKEIQEKYNWPYFVGCSTGKNKPESILNAVSKLMPDSLVVSNSMQSANPKTLEAIKRKNINTDGYRQVQMEIQKRGLRSMADVILGLPFETLESHFNALKELIDSGVQEFTSYQAMVLKSTDLELEAKSMKYGIQTKWRVLPRAIGKYQVIDKEVIIPELEQIIVSSDTLSFDDYLSARKLHLTTMIYHNSGIFKMIHKYLNAENIPVSDFILKVYESLSDNDSPLKPVYEGFIKETKSELFDSEKECFDFYSDAQNFERVKRSEIGGNLLWKYLAVTFFRYWTAAVQVGLDALQHLVTLEAEELEDIQIYLNSRIANVSDNEIIKNVNFKIRSNRFAEYLFESDEIVKVKNAQMMLNDSKFRTLMHAKTLYPNDPTGWSLILAVHRVHTVTRELN